MGLMSIRVLLFAIGIVCAGSTVAQSGAWQTRAQQSTLLVPKTIRANF